MALPNSSNISSVGASAKVNYQNLPPSDLTIDWDNSTLAPAITDIANGSLTASRFICNITLATTIGALVLNSWSAVWQNATTTTPVLGGFGDGYFTITLPVSVSDQYTQSIGSPSSIPVNLIAGIGCLGGSTNFGFVNVSCSTNVITVNLADHTGSPAYLTGSTLSIFCR